MNRSLRFAITAAIVLVAAPCLRAQVTYRVDGWPPPAGVSYETFNNSVGTETEDCWVANSFQAIDGGNLINSLTFALGTAPGGGNFTLQVTVILYTGTSLTSPTGLVRVVPATNTVTLTNQAPGSLQTINFATPTFFNTGQIFYAAVLIRGVTGSTFPFASDLFTPGPSPTNQLRSFFDVGPTIGGAYNLDNTANATRLGLNHPVLGGPAQSAANLVLRVNAIPEPSSVLLIGAGVGLIAYRLRRKRS